MRSDFSFKRQQSCHTTSRALLLSADPPALFSPPGDMSSSKLFQQGGSINSTSVI